MLKKQEINLMFLVKKLISIRFIHLCCQKNILNELLRPKVPDILFLIC